MSEVRDDQLPDQSARVRDIKFGARAREQQHINTWIRTERRSAAHGSLVAEPGWLVSISGVNRALTLRSRSSGLAYLAGL